MTAIAERLLEYLRRVPGVFPRGINGEIIEGGTTTMEAGVVIDPDGRQQVVISVTNTAWSEETAQKCARDLDDLVADYLENHGGLYGIDPGE